MQVVKSKMFSDVISDYSDSEEDRIEQYKQNIKSAKMYDDKIKDYIIS